MNAMGSAEEDPSWRDLQNLSTVSLLARARSGDERAKNALLARYRPKLRRILHGKLSLRARGCLDTEDIVQNTLQRALNPMERFQPRDESAWLRYLLRIAANLIRDEWRKANRRPAQVELNEDLAEDGPTPFEDTVSAEDWRRYEEALKRMPADYVTAIRLRLEFQYTYGEIAAAMERSTENAARLLLQRAMKRLAWEMRERPGE